MPRTGGPGDDWPELSGVPHRREGLRGKGEAEPCALRRSRAFQEVVRRDFAENSKHEDVHFERRVSFAGMPRVRKRSGRMDVFIDGMGEDIAIYEIKATDWDRIKPANRRRNVYRHWKQLIEYVEKYIEVDGVGGVSLGIIYPAPPKTPGLRAYVEETVEEYGACAYWLTEVRGPVGGLVASRG